MGVMTAAQVLESSLSGLVDELGTRLSQIGRAELAEAMEPLAVAMRDASTEADADRLARTAFDLCRLLYSNGRSAEGLPLGKTILDAAE